jgi:23S rRNA pseudouridine2605 synthase/23S rRNA pseudouridine2604 synthase
MAMMRLQKWLAEAGVCSRRHGEALIRAGRVRVNGQVVTTLGAKADPGQDRIDVDGKPVVASSEMVYVLLHKPPGYVTSCSHPGQKIVLDLVDLPQRLFPVGRLDKDSSGLLLLTNDGPMHHRLSHPSFDHEKEYEVTVDRPIEDGALRAMARGLPLGGVVTRPARVRRLATDRFRIVLQEGRNRQIRRMVRNVGYAVLALKRIRIAHLLLGNLAPGQWRLLTAEERDTLRRVTRPASRDAFSTGLTGRRRQGPRQGSDRPAGRRSLRERG